MGGSDRERQFRWLDEAAAREGWAASLEHVATKKCLALAFPNATQQPPAIGSGLGLPDGEENNPALDAAFRLVPCPAARSLREGAGAVSGGGAGDDL